MDEKADRIKEVTPCVGVWIETVRMIWILWKTSVTPCVGVWIETISCHNATMLGLVTPCVGVWIETSDIIISKIETRSHPAWVCGLKHHR